MSLTPRDVTVHKDELLNAYEIAPEGEQQEFLDVIDELHEKLAYSMQSDTVTQRVFTKMGRITDAISNDEDLKTVLRTILKGVLEVFPHQELAGAICAFDESRPDKYQFVHETYVLGGNDKVQLGFMKNPTRNGYKISSSDGKRYLGTGMTVMMKRSGLQPKQRPVYIDDVVTKWPTWMPPLNNPLDPQLASTAYLPLMIGKKRVGIITLQFSAPHIFSSAEKNELYLYAKTAASALHNVQLQQERTLMLNNFKSLQAMISENIMFSTSTDLQALAKRVADFMLPFEFSSFVLYLSGVSDDTSKTFLATYEKNRVHLQVVMSTSLPYPSFWWIADFWKAHKESKIEYTDREKWLWVIGYPLLIADRFLGLFFVTRLQAQADKILGMNKGQEREDDVYPFLINEKQLLGQTAQELALLIEDLHRKKLLLSKLQVIGEVTNMISDHPGISHADLVAKIGDYLGKMFSKERTQIISYDGMHVRYLKVFQTGREDKTRYDYRKDSEKNLTGYVLDAGQTVFIPSDPREYIQTKKLDINLKPEMPSSYIGVPIKREGYVYGLIQVEGSEKTALDDSDRLTIEALAALLGRDWPEEETK